MYAVSNVVQEALVSSHSSIEVLAMLGTGIVEMPCELMKSSSATSLWWLLTCKGCNEPGLFGSIVSTIQAAVLEHKEIAKLQLHDAKIISCS